jgi:hypothetical protein
MKRLVFFSISFLFCLQLQAQWSVYDSGKEYQVLVSTAQGQPAIYKNVPCEVKLVSLKNKILKLTSSNATVTPNTEPGSYSIQTSDDNAVLQIYSAKKSKMKLLNDIQIRTVDVPLLDELTLSGNNLSVGYSYGMQFNSGESSPYDQQVFSKSFVVESWTFSCPSVQGTISGSGNQLSQNVTSFLRYLPEGVKYEIRASYYGLDTIYHDLTQAFTSQNAVMPAAKYVVLNNTPANKAWFDDKDQGSLIGMLNNNYIIESTLFNPIGRKASPKDGIFLSSGLDSSLVNDGMDSQSIRDLNYNANLKYVEYYDYMPNTKSIIVNGEMVSVYVKKGADNYPKDYYNWDPMIEQLDPSTETLDPNEAEIIPGTENNPIPFNVEYRVKSVNFAYTTDSIQQIIIRYDSVLNIATGAIEIQPTRISLARKFGKNDLADIVFSMKVKDLVKFQSYAPTIQLKNDKTNANLFDLENPKSLLGYLNTKKVRESGIASFPALNRRGAEEFGDDCDPNGKNDGKLIETETEIGQVFEKYIVDPSMGYAVNVYYKKGSATDIKIFNQFNQFEADILDEKNETTKVEEAELDPNGLPYQVSCRIDYLKNSQYRGLTDLFIKRKYLYDPIYGVYVAKPISIGYAQQMPGQSKPTLIMKVELNSDPKLMSMLPKMQSQLFLSQPWALSLLQNDIEYAGETIDASDIPTLQKKFQFRKKMVSIMGDMELSNEPHF